MSTIFPKLLQASKHAISNNDYEALALLTRQTYLLDKFATPKIRLMTVLEQADIQLNQSSKVKHPTLIAKDALGRIEIHVVTPEKMDLESTESQFLLAHILGHILIDFYPSMAEGNFRKSGFTEQESPLQRYITGKTKLEEKAFSLEARADEFAASLILPQVMLKKALQALSNSKQVASFFGVTEEFLVARIEHIETLISSRTKSTNTKPTIKAKSSRV